MSRAARPTDVCARRGLRRVEYTQNRNRHWRCVGALIYYEKVRRFFTIAEINKKKLKVANVQSLSGTGPGVQNGRIFVR